MERVPDLGGHPDGTYALTLMNDVLAYIRIELRPKLASHVAPCFFADVVDGVVGRVKPIHS